MCKLERKYCKVLYKEYSATLSRLNILEATSEALYIMKRRSEELDEQIIDETLCALDLQNELKLLARSL